MFIFCFYTSKTFDGHNNVFCLKIKVRSWPDSSVGRAKD
ncbi:hypothetical protein wTpre_340 [Wolbachia endosymbiont of Trichogramma pretiosum]|nr:hypothetical protein wTpre_340 [Wolbachia endosymbiont of Trichogramma pretiosum]